MQPIPTPRVLDPERPLANDRGDFGTAEDHRARADLLDNALHESCAYAQQLWHHLDAVHHYLIESLPSDPRSPGLHPRVSAAPTGPNDERGWDDWITAFASVASVLCGPQGDSGYGLGEARRKAEERRTAPVLNFHASHPDLGDSERAAGSTARHQDWLESSPREQHSPDSGSATGKSSGLQRPALIAVLVVLAVRGLRPRRSRTRWT